MESREHSIHDAGRTWRVDLLPLRHVPVVQYVCIARRAITATLKERQGHAPPFYPPFALGPRSSLSQIGESGPKRPIRKRGRGRRETRRKVEGKTAFSPLPPPQYDDPRLMLGAHQRGSPEDPPSVCSNSRRILRGSAGDPEGVTLLESCRRKEWEPL